MLKPDKKFVVDKRMEEAIQEISKVPECGFYSDISAKLKWELDVQLKKMRIPRRAWLKETVQKFLDSCKNS